MPDDADVSSGKSAFADFALDPRILKALDDLGFDAPTPIQSQAMEPLLAGRDVIGRARTGSGKTAAFGLPLLQRVLEPKPGVGTRALVVTPTRELALQVSEALRSYAAKLKLYITTIYGGAPYHSQLKDLRRGVPVVVGTPGRLVDHLDRGSLDLSGVDVVVLDEADEMLRMGFIEDVERLLESAGDDRQVALFSASMPRPIQKVAKRFLRDPEVVQVEAEALTVSHIEQSWIRVPERHKLDALVRVLQTEDHDAVLVFAKTRKDCADTAEALRKRGMKVEPLHGDLNQPAREKVVRRMRKRDIQVVIATDVAARGLDVKHITHVVNLALPTDTETYVHRIGRTGRAGAEGAAISFVTAKEVGRLRRMQRELKADMTERLIPSDAEVVRRQEAILQDELRGALDKKAHAKAQDRLSELLEEMGWSAEEVAAAALSLLASQRGHAFHEEASAKPPTWSTQAKTHEKKTFDKGRGKPERERKHSDRPKDFGSVNEVQLFLSIGNEAGVRPADVVGALANEAGISGSVIGKIKVLARKTFVGVPEDVAEHLLTHYSSLVIRGRDARVSRSHDYGAGEAKPFGGARPPGRTAHKQDKGKGKGGWKPPKRKKSKGD